MEFGTKLIKFRYMFPLRQSEWWNIGERLNDETCVRKKWCWQSLLFGQNIRRFFIYFFVFNSVLVSCCLECRIGIFIISSKLSCYTWAVAVWPRIYGPNQARHLTGWLGRLNLMLWSKDITKEMWRKYIEQEQLIKT